MPTDTTTGMPPGPAQTSNVTRRLSAAAATAAALVVTLIAVDAGIIPSFRSHGVTPNTFIDERRLPTTEPVVASTALKQDGLSQKGTTPAQPLTAELIANQFQQSDAVETERLDTNPQIMAASAAMAITTGSLQPLPVVTPCGDSVAVTVQPGGQWVLRAANRCRSGQSWTIRYGAVAFARQLDDRGRGEFLLDLFQGRSAAVSVEFESGSSVPVKAPGDSNLSPDSAPAHVSKVAVVWQGTFKLDLHAFEYAAAAGHAGHVWSGAPGTPDAATDAAASNRGRGFLTRMDDEDPAPAVKRSFANPNLAPDTDTISPDNFSTATFKAQTYTVIHGANQINATIAIAVDYASRGPVPSGQACDDGRFAKPLYRIYRLAPDGTVHHEQQVLAAARCGAPLLKQARFQTGIVPDLKLRR
jgi:hypothetical protein